MATREEIERMNRHLARGRELQDAQNSPQAQAAREALQARVFAEFIRRQNNRRDPVWRTAAIEAHLKDEEEKRRRREQEAVRQGEELVRRLKHG